MPEIFAKSEIRSVRAGFRMDGWLLALLIVSLILRVVLVHDMKFGFWPDENRYNAAESAAAALCEGDFRKACDEIFAGADHLGYKVAMIAPAMGRSFWHWGYAVLPFLSSGIFSVANIAWIYALARRLGGDAEEARWAALFAAASNSLFYWSRHLVPYDMAMCFGLACLWVSLHPTPRWHQSLLAGALGFLTFVTYNGYWTLAGFALVAHVVRGWPSWKEVVLRTVFGLSGLVLPFIALLFAAAWDGSYLFDSYVSFAGSINQGDFADGYKVLAGYLWFTEGAFVGVWLAAVGTLGMLFFRGRSEIPARAWLWFAGLLALAASFVVLSNLLEKFVVYGRLVRQLVPFFALLTGWAAVRWCKSDGGTRRWRWGLATIAIAIAAWNFSGPLTRDFNFYGRAETVIGAYWAREKAAGLPLTPFDRFRVINAGYMWPGPVEIQLPPHEVLLYGRHPLEFRPFLYEGYDRKQRAAILAADIRPCLVLIKD